MNLILFFNGWGMDNNAVASLNIPKDYELKEVHFPYEVNLDQMKYKKIIAIGWSFGCYYLSKYLQSSKLICDEIIAVNGHGELIGKYGINPKMLKMTLETLTPENLKKFYINMGIDENFIEPNRDYVEIANELRFFCENYSGIANVFTKAIIADNDKIIPTAKQKKYF